jgi:hypothetical protein
LIRSPSAEGNSRITPNQDPYNQTLISDALRQQLKVPPLPEQQAQFPSFPKSQGANATTKKN